MPCLIGCLALLSPRIVLLLLWLFDNAWMTQPFQTVIWPVLGFILLPLTTLAYALAWHLGDGSITNMGIILIVLGVLIDLGMLGGGGRTARPASRPTHSQS